MYLRKITFALLFVTGIIATQHLYCQSVTIDTIVNSGPKDNRINFAFANVDHATANSYQSRDVFLSDLTDITERFDPNSPKAKNGFSQYRRFFNLYSVWFDDPFVFEPVPAYYIESQAFIDSLFLPWADEQHGWVTMMYTLKGGGGGGAGRRDDLRRGDALIWGLDWETVLHEFNHTMPGVGDEYTASGEWSNFVCNESPNQTPALVIDDVPWRRWIQPGTPIPTPYAQEYFGKIGAFEGTISGYFGCQRPTAQSCYMGAGGFGEGFGQDMCAVCLQRFVCRTYQFVDAIENELPELANLEISNEQTVSFSVNAIKPIPNTQQYKWYLNGKLIAEGVEAVDITFGECEGYEVRFELLDTTNFVRYDEAFDYLYPEPRQSHVWTVNNIDVNSSDLQAEVSTINADCSGQANGQILIDAMGGTAPYSYIINEKVYTGDIDNLAPGSYELIILDAEGCDLVRNIIIEQDPLTAFEIASEFENGIWKLFPVFDEDSESSNYTYRWSDGSNRDTLITVQKGTYHLTVINPEACQSQRTLDLLETPCANLEVASEIVHSGPEEGGAIFLDISYGTEPYQVNWYKGELQDLTMPDPSAVFSSGNDQIDRHPDEYLFDDVIEYNVDFWAEGFTGENFAGYDFGSPQTITYYSITSNVDVPGRDARSWLIEGSNDTINWEVVDARADVVFENRLQRKEFILDEPATYRAFRIKVTENNGDGWVAIQEMEFGTDANLSEIKTSRDDRAIVNISEGKYAFVVTDANQNRVSGSAQIENNEEAQLQSLTVVQHDAESVTIENIDPLMAYFWYADSDAEILLHRGNVFQPEAAGNYYVRAVDRSEKYFSSAIKGFAVTMFDAPEVEGENGMYSIINPLPNAEYYWYDQRIGGNAIHVGDSIQAPEMGDYYVSMRMATQTVNPVNPDEVGDITLWADAADIDGDNLLDEGLSNSSAYKWQFRVNGNWDQNGWHAYRSNYANGLGVVELGTVWFQYVQNETADMRSFIICYEENGFSREGTAPFYGLKPYMGRAAGQDQLFSDNVLSNFPNSTAYLNGHQVDPSDTHNSYQMKTLSVNLENSASLNLYACDEYWEGKIAELIVFDRVLDESETAGLHEYMRRKWLSTADLASPRTKVIWSAEEQIYESTEEVEICRGQDYMGLTEEGNYIREMKTCEGIDSIVTTIISYIEPTPEMIPELSIEDDLLSTEFVAQAYQWYYEGVPIEGATDMVYTVMLEGNYQVEVTDEEGCKVLSETVNYTTTGIEEITADDYHVFPNPTKDFITIENKQNKAAIFLILDARGQKILELSSRTSPVVLDISHMPAGLYYLHILGQNGRVVKKITKL